MIQWPQNPVIYEINTWAWLYDLSVKYNNPITLENIPVGEWDEIRKCGFDAVWLMGVWERSRQSVVVSNENELLQKEFRSALPDYAPEDNIGSAYCVHKYAVDKRLGGDAALAAVRQELAGRGLLLILDFVPNHVARDHHWVTDHPEYFVRGSTADLLSSSQNYFESNHQIIAFGRDPYFPAWQDVAQLNAFNPGQRITAINVLDKVAQKCDGVRCDMAMLELSHVFSQTWGERAGAAPEKEYWQEVISATREQHPNFLFLAEAYWDLEWQLIQCGFDYCYDKRLYDSLLSNDPNQVYSHLTAGMEYQKKLVRFVENHDEQRVTTAFPARKGILAAITSYTIPGAKLIHEGQMEGRKIKLPVFLRRRAPEPLFMEQQKFYRQLIRTAGSPLLKEGEWKICTCSGWENHDSNHNLLAWSVQNNKQTLLVVINYSDIRSQALVHVPRANLAGLTWRLVDLFKGDVYIRSGDDMVGPGLFVDLSPWDFHFLWFARTVESRM